MLAEAAKQTFGMLLPAYDRPQTLERVRAWFESAGLRDIHVGLRTSLIVARDTKPETRLSAAVGA